MNVSLPDVSAFADRYISAPDAQGGAALIAYTLARGYSFADSACIEEAQHLLERVWESESPQSPETRRIYEACSRYLQHRARIDGGWYTVADCNRVNWYNRKRAEWKASFPATDWPGGKPWQLARMAHLTAEGWTSAEIAGALELTRRSIRTRLTALAQHNGALLAQYDTDYFEVSGGVTPLPDLVNPFALEDTNNDH